MKADDKMEKSWQNSRFYTCALWLLTVFMLLGALTFFPSASSVLMLLCALVAMPAKPVQRLLASWRLGGSVRFLLMAVLFVLATVLAPV
ncbi:MAG: hypothetical protein HFF73_05980 [Oscillospiraceae bacterium]|nr:hypothetical protein [Oscillospiraceae bacterium]